VHAVKPNLFRRHRIRGIHRCGAGFSGRMNRPCGWSDN
jgi:hypothetical protein